MCLLNFYLFFVNFTNVISSRNFKLELSFVFYGVVFCFPLSSNAITCFTILFCYLNFWVNSLKIKFQRGY